jgi:phosphatidylserine/phosphatidylglycerophosphate/cardiolipin synthase-like enzyme
MSRRSSWMRFSCLLLAVGCAGGGPAGAPPAVGPAAAFELVETFPVETSLDHPDIPDAHDVWLAMIDGARHRIDLAQFYASNRAGSRLEAVVRSIERAADRGVVVRFLADSRFVATYPDTLERLDRRAGIEVRTYDGAAFAGGVLHAKYFLVDDREAFLGSQNFDWRALTHIQELGLRVRDRGVLRAMADVFATDWALAGKAARSFRASPPTGGYRYGRGVSAVFSPRGWLPDERMWDLPRLVELIDSARRTARVQLLTYRADLPELDGALRRAAARGVRVQILVSDWTRRPATIDGIKALHEVDGIDVAFLVIPPWSGGFIPFARVAHAKYLVVDGERLWLGTSNWERDYFHASRNVGVVIEDPLIGAQLDAFFAGNWRSQYAELVDPDRQYTAPRISDHSPTGPPPSAPSR